jgi:uncharacterized protein (DUF2267 family)
VNLGQLLKDIQRRAELDSEDDAMVAAQAVLSVLGERLAGGQPEHLAAQLPRELAEALPERGAGDAFDDEEFDRRVAVREGHGVDLLTAHRHAAAVMNAVLGAVSEGERADVAAQLPADYIDLLP